MTPREIPTPVPVNLSPDTRFLIEWFDRRMAEMHDAVTDQNRVTQDLTLRLVTCQTQHATKDRGSEKQQATVVQYLAPLVAGIVGGVAVALLNLVILRK